MSNNSYEVRDIPTIDNKNVKLGKTFKYGDNYHLTNIYYMDNANVANNNANVANTIAENEAKRQDAVEEKTKFIIQTPLMYVPNSMIYFNDKPFLELSFNNEENDKDVLEFKKWFLALEDYIFKLLKRRTTLGISNNTISSVIKSGYNNTSTKLLVPININISKCVLSDECKRNKILFNWEIPVPTYAISVIWIKNIWVKKGKWGLNLFMYASRVMNSHILDPIDFMGQDADNKSIKTFDVINKFHKDEKMSILVGQVPEYTMYFKMLKMGIPKDAIKQKMTLMGVDARVIDYPDTAPYITVLHYINNPQLGPYVKSNTSQNSVPPPPPPPMLMNGLSSSGLGGCSVGGGRGGGSVGGGAGSNSVMSNLLSEISQGGFKLKKMDPKDKILNKLQNNNSTGLKVPSLMDIQGALAKLKKVDLDG
jgi:hypothetical protein